MKKSQLRIPALIVVALALILFLQHQGVFTQAKALLFHAKPQGPTVADAGNDKESQQVFADHIHEESTRLAQSKEDPEALLIQEKSLAVNLKPSEMEILKLKALDDKASGNERTFYIQLLRMNGSLEAQAKLEEIALSMPSDQQDVRRNLRESMLRAQAIESLKSKPALEDVLKKTKDAFLVERTHKALQRLSGSAALDQEPAGVTK